MIEELQVQMIALFNQANQAANYLKKIEEYGGQLAHPEKVINTPSLYVDVATQGVIETDDILGELYTGTLAPDIFLFDHNKASGKAKKTSLAKGMDWVLDALKGKIITVNGVRVVVAKRINFRVISDYFKPVAIISPTLTIMED